MCPCANCLKSGRQKHEQHPQKYSVAQNTEAEQEKNGGSRSNAFGDIGKTVAETSHGTHTT